MPSLLLNLTAVAACCAGLLMLSQGNTSEVVDLPGQPPTLQSDPANTYYLSGKHYRGESPWGEMVLSFRAQTVSVYWQSWATDALQQRDIGFSNGRWTVNAQGQLLLQFASEQWMLFNIEQGLGEERMYAYQFAHLGNTHFLFTEIDNSAHPFTALIADTVPRA